MEVESLGIKVDSSQVQALEQHLDALMARSKKTEAQTQALIDKLTVQGATLKLTSRETQMFTLALGGATDAQLKEADAVLKAIEAHEALEKKLKGAEEANKKMVAGFKAGAVVIGSAISSIVTAAGTYLVVLEKMIGKTADYQDIAEKVGTSASGIASLRTAADVAGVGIDQVGKNLTMMQRQLSKTNDESKGAAKGLQAIGLNIDDIRKMAPEEAYFKIAKALDEVTDSSGKQAIAQDILGRGAAEQGVILKQLATQKQLDKQLTDEQIKVADDYKDAIAEQKSQLSQQMESISLLAIPTMFAFRGAIKDTISQMFGLSNNASDLAKNHGVADWAESAALAIASVVDWGVKAFNVLRGIGEGVASLAAAAAAVLRADLTDQKSLQAAGNAVRDIYEANSKKVSEFMTGPSFRANLEKQLQMIKDNGGKIAKAEDEILAPKKDRSGYTSAEKTDGSAKKAESEYQSLIETINKRIALEEAEIAGQRKLTDSEKFAIDITTKLNSAKSGLNAAQRAAVLTKLEEAKATDALLESERRRIKNNQDAYNAEARMDAERQAQEKRDFDSVNKIRLALDEQAQATKDDAAAAQIDANMIGETDAARKAALVTLKEHIRLQKELDKINDPNAGFKTQEDRQEALDRAAVESSKRLQVELGKIETDGARDRYEKSNSIAHQFFTDLFTDGTSAFKNLGRSLKTLLIDALYELTAKKWVIQIASSITGEGGIAGAASSLIGGGGGSIPGMSGLSGITSLLSGAVGSFGAGATTGLSALIGGYGGGALSAGASMIGAGQLAGGLGMIAGTLGPIALGVYGLYKIFGKSGGGPQVGGNVGMVGNGVAPEDRSMNAQLQQNLNAANQTFDKLMSQLGVLNPGITFGQSASADPRGTSASSVATQVLRNGQVVSQQTAWQTVGRTDEAMSAELARQLTEGMITAVHQSNIDREILSYFDQITAGLDTAGKASALQTLPAIAALKNAFEGLSYVFPQLSNLSIAAKVAMANMAGGIDQLAGLMNGFMSNFYTAGERLAVAGGQLQTALSKAGIAIDLTNASLADYRNMVMGINTATTEGQQAFVAALQASATFAEYKREQQAEVERARQEWEQEQARIQSEMDKARSEWEQRRSQAENTLSQAYQRQRSEIERTIDTLENWKDSLASLRNDLSADSSLSPLTTMQQYEAARQRFAQVSAGAESGDPKAQADFDSAARQLLTLSRQVNASGIAYDNDFNLVSATLSQLEKAATSQISDAQKQLQVLDSQVSVLISINQGVVSVAQAIYDLRAVMAQKPAEYVAPPPPVFTPPPVYVPPPPASTGGAGGSGSAFRDIINNATIAPLNPFAPGVGGSGMGGAEVFTGYGGPSSEMDGYYPEGWHGPTGSELAGGIERVPTDRYRALLHKDEAVVPASNADFFRSGSQGLVAQVARLTAEVQKLRAENREDAGNVVSATLDAADSSARITSDATVRAARQRQYQTKTRPILS